MNDRIGGVRFLALAAFAAAALCSSFATPGTTAEANKKAYDAYNNNSAPEEVTVQGIVVSQPKRYDSTLVPKVQQDGVGFGVLVMQDPSANRSLDGQVYSNGIKVLFGSNYGTIPAGTVFPMSLANRQLYGFPQEGDLIEVTGLAIVSWDTISAVFPLSIADEPVIDMRSSITYPQITILSENNVVTPTAVTPATFAQPPFSRLPNSSVVGLLDLHSRKGSPGFGQGNLIPHPMCGMLVTASGTKWDTTNPKNTQPSYNNGKVGFMLGHTGATNFNDAAQIFINCRASLSTGETPNPIDCSGLAPGSTDPVTGIVNSHLLIAGKDTWNVAGIQVRHQSDIPNTGGPSNRVSFVTVDPALNNAPIPGGQVDITLTGLEGNPGQATITVDLTLLGVGGAVNLSNTPISTLTLTPVAPNSNTYKGSFKLTSASRQGYYAPTIHYVNVGTDILINSSTAFSPILNAVPFRSAAALRMVMNNLPDGFPVAIDASIPGTISPIVVVNEAEGASYLSSSAQIWVADPLAPAGLNIFLPDGSKALPQTQRGDAISIAGTLLTFSGRREITSRLSFLNIESFGNPVPPPYYINTNMVSADYHDTNSAERIPASKVPLNGTLVTVVGKVTASPSTIRPSGFPQYVDIDDGSGPITLKLDNRYTDALSLPNLRTFLPTGSTVVVTGVCCSETISSSNQTIVRELWVQDLHSIAKSPTTSTVNVTMSGGQQVVTLPAPADPLLLGTPSIIPGGIGAKRLFDGVLYTGAPAVNDPWWKGLEFLQVGEGYKVTGTPANFSYTGITSGTGTDFAGVTQSFDIDSLPHLHGLFNSRQEQLIGISYTGNSVLWDADGPTNAFYGYDGGSLQSYVGAMSTALSALKDDGGSAVTSPNTFAAGEGARVTTPLDQRALVIMPSAEDNTCSVTVGFQAPTVYIGSLALPVDVQLRYPGGTTPIVSVSTTLNGSGEMTLSNVPAGVYDVWIKPCGFCADTITGVAVSAPCGSGTVVAHGPTGDGLIAGDAASQNQVNVFALNTVLIHFATSDVCPIDVNGDGFVDVFDLNITLSNFGKSGTP